MPRPGPIGVSQWRSIFNQYAGPNQPLTNEVTSFDQYWGHPQQTGQYHYRRAKIFNYGKTSKSALLGFLLDGFPCMGLKKMAPQSLTPALMPITATHMPQPIFQQAFIIII